MLIDLRQIKENQSRFKLNWFCTVWTKLVFSQLHVATVSCCRWAPASLCFPLSLRFTCWIGSTFSQQNYGNGFKRFHNKRNSGIVELRGSLLNHNKYDLSEHIFINRIIKLPLKKDTANTKKKRVKRRENTPKNKKKGTSESFLPFRYQSQIQTRAKHLLQYRKKREWNKNSQHLSSTQQRAS